MFEVKFVLFVLFINWFADYFCQNDKMALNKSHSWLALSSHSIVYFVVMFTGLLFYDFFAKTMYCTPLFLLNFPAHFLTDAVTSRINAKLFLSNKRHWFFVSIGFDQWLHYVVLFLTLNF